ncbi:MAG: plasmid maintenance system killer protein [Clostridia bacterium]|nr:plasmid maintenance system killer protein [Clostridia bacterium]
MIVHFSNGKLEKKLCNIRLLKKYYSNDYQKISNRLSEMRAANNLSEIPEVPPPRRHKLSNNLKDCWGIDYSKNDRIIIRPCGEYDINDLTTITEIEIIDLEDYH